jgi:hypothetical protein
VPLAAAGGGGWRPRSLTRAGVVRSLTRAAVVRSLTRAEVVRSLTRAAVVRSLTRAVRLALVLLAACSAPPAALAPPPPAPTVASAVPTSTPPAPPRQSSRRTDARWLLAGGDDPLDRERLAVAVGAAELLDGVADGGDTAAVALLALPHADDAEVALGRLTELLRGGGPPRRALLEAILGIAGRPRRPREALDPDGARRCGEAMLALAADPAAPPEERALAESAARALAEHGYVDRARIAGPAAAQSR